MDTRISEAVNKYADLIIQQYSPSKIYLYGSYAKGQNDFSSDIDVAIVFPSMPISEYMKIWGELFSLAADIDERIEPNLLIDDGIEDKYSMFYEVVTTGVEITPALTVSA